MRHIQYYRVGLIVLAITVNEASKTVDIAPGFTKRMATRRLSSPHTRTVEGL